ncbi:MAG TPA: M13 family metallopeptidase [Polyangiaceae bacterium]|nr:M13 family metallopeptidase [Polyangiaceae bacterium]
MISPARLISPSFVLVLALALASCARGPRSADNRCLGSGAPGHSIDLEAMDRSVRPGTDFFLFANGNWYKKTEIPADRGGTGLFLRLAETVESRTKGLLEEAARAPEGTDLRRVGDYYASYLDENAIEKRGLAPLTLALERLGKVTNKRELATLFGSELRADVDPLNSTHFSTSNLLGLWVEQDLNDTSQNTAYVLQGGLGMPDRSHYLDESPGRVALRVKYERHLATIFKLAQLADADARAARVLVLERKIAGVHASRTDSEDVGKANNPWKRTDFGARAPGMEWEAFFAAARLDQQPAFIVWHAEAVSGLSKLVASEPLETWKDLVTAHTIDHFADVLPKAFADEQFAFYSKEMRGVPVNAPRPRRAQGSTNDALGDAVGKAYVARYFPASSKQAIEEMVKNLMVTFGHRVDALTWMSPATKAKAKEKLSTLRVGIGYPDSFRDDSGLSIVFGDAFGNLERAELHKYRLDLAKLGRPVDRGEWAMFPQEVNAVNLPIRNALNFPAAILVPPFFDPRATVAANYGGIGSVIGHEISHSFDDQGAKFDARGRFANWWTPEDLAHFEASGAALAQQFSAYRPLPDAKVDGKLTLGENIADLAGLAAAHDGWRASLGGAPAPVQDGLTGEQQFFLAYAQCWQSKTRDELLRESLATNGHAPARYRVLTVRNLDDWYQAFAVEPRDALYLAPEQRVRVW